MTTLMYYECNRCKTTKTKPVGWVAYRAINHHAAPGPVAAYDWSNVPTRHLCCECADLVGVEAFPFRNSAPLSPGWKG